MKNPRFFRIEALLKRHEKMKNQLVTMEYKSPKFYMNDVATLLHLEKEITIQAAYLEHEGEFIYEA